MSKATYQDLIDHLEAALRIARRMQDPERRSALGHASLHRRMVEAYDQSLELSEQAEANDAVQPSEKEKPAATHEETTSGIQKKSTVDPEEKKQEESLAKEEMSMRQDDVRTEQNSQYHQPESVFLGENLSGETSSRQAPEENVNEKKEELKDHAPENQALPKAQQEAKEEHASKDQQAGAGTSEEEPEGSQKARLGELERKRRKALIQKKKARKKAKTGSAQATNDALPKQEPKLKEQPPKPPQTPENTPTEPPKADFTDRLSQANTTPLPPGKHLYETFNRGQSSVNERLQSEQEKRDQALAEKLKHRPVNDLTRAVTLNERVRFIRELFNGQAEALRNALHELNGAEDWETARWIMDEQLAPRYSWPQSGEGLELFRGLVKRKFLS